MGALGNSGDGRIFINTFQGNFTTRANSETEGAVKRTNKNNKLVYENHFNIMKDVLIQEFEKRASEEYGDSWNIKLAHAKSDETYTLTLPYSGRLTMGVFFRLPNLDINKPMNLRLFWFADEEKAALVIYQNDQKVEAFWTKDNKGDMPELEQVTVNNKPVWDSSKRMVFIENYLETVVKPKMNDIEAGQPDLSTGNGLHAEVTQEPQSEVEPIWDADAKCLKLEFEGKWYECNEMGVFKTDQKGKKIEALPF